MTSQEYNRNLDVIRQLYPDSDWMPLLERGFNPANVLYMKEAFKELKLNVRNIVENNTATIQTATIDSATIDTEYDLTDKYLAELYIKLNKLQGNRAKFSNKFHACVSDRQRGEVSRDIATLQAAIGSTMKSIDYYKATGIKVDDIEDDFELPNDKFALSKKLNVIRAMVSKIKKRIRELEQRAIQPSDSLNGEPRYSAADRKLLEQEKNTLKKYLIEKLYAEQKLDSL